VVNRELGQVCITNEDAVRVVQWLDPQATVADLVRTFPALAAATEPVHEGNRAAEARPAPEAARAPAMA